MKKILFSVLACFAMLSANAQTVTIENLNYVKGAAGSFDICVKTDADIFSAYSFYMYFPEALNFDSKKSRVLVDGKCVADNDMSYTWTATTAIPEKAGYKRMMLAAYDGDNAVMATSEGGSLVTIKYLASDLDVEVLPIIIQKIAFAEPNGTSHPVEGTVSAIFNLDNDKAANGAVAYDLTGRKTTTNAPGVKVINGKKVIK